MNTIKYEKTTTEEKEVNLKFKEALEHLDPEAHTYFVLLFDSKDPDQMTVLAQGEAPKLNAALTVILNEQQKHLTDYINKHAVKH